MSGSRRVREATSGAGGIAEVTRAHEVVDLTLREPDTEGVGAALAAGTVSAERRG